MPRPKRSDIVIPDEIQTFRCIYRCIRYCRIAGTHPVTRKSCEHRRQWVSQRLEDLSELFAIECLLHRVENGEFECVIRTRPDVASKWSDREVAKRWCTLFPHKTPEHEREKAERERIDGIADDKQRVQELRNRLKDISWYMRCFAANIAERANEEDGVKGRFWDGRFKPTLLLDDHAQLATAVAIECSSPEPTCGQETNSRTGAVGRQRSPEKRRKTRRTNQTFEFEFTCCSSSEFRALKTWTANQFKARSSGEGKNRSLRVLKALGLDRERWLEVVRTIRAFSGCVAGTKASIQAEVRKHAERSFFRAKSNPLAGVS